MTDFPRTEVGGISMPRMIVGTNWFLGYSHCTQAKSHYIKANVQDRDKIADILEVFFKNGVNAVMGQIGNLPMPDAIAEAEQRTGVKAIIVSTPTIPTGPETPANGFDQAELDKILDFQVEHGVAICMPHQSTTDNMVDRCTREIRHFDQVCKAIRDRGMIPGLSTHMPESITYADESGLDVETYISMYNSMGFLMQVEVDWISRLIQGAKKPVMTIKPMAAGHLRPFQGLTFVWNTIRDTDMVTIGTMSPREAAEVIEMSLSILERRTSSAELQETRSKASIKTK